VLGWSMGGMIAQALAVSHPAQVSRLILAATAVGTGKALPLPPSAASQCVCLGRSPAQVVAQLFPKNQAAAARAYLNDIEQYPGLYGISAAAFQNQYLAVQRWLAGQDAAGRQVGDLRVPTLVAGGTRDRFIVTANDRLLASSVPGAKLLLFDDAGHAFWFQDAAWFIRAVETFIALKPHKLRCASNQRAPIPSRSPAAGRETLDMSADDALASRPGPRTGRCRDVPTSAAQRTWRMSSSYEAISANDRQAAITRPVVVGSATAASPSPPGCPCWPPHQQRQRLLQRCLGRKTRSHGRSPPIRTLRTTASGFISTPGAPSIRASLHGVGMT